MPESELKKRDNNNKTAHRWKTKTQKRATFKQSTNNKKTTEERKKQRTQLIEWSSRGQIWIVKSFFFQSDDWCIRIQSRNILAAQSKLSSKIARSQRSVCFKHEKKTQINDQSIFNFWFQLFYAIRMWKQTIHKQTQRTTATNSVRSLRLCEQKKTSSHKFSNHKIFLVKAKNQRNNLIKCEKTVNVVMCLCVAHSKWSERRKKRDCVCIEAPKRKKQFFFDNSAKSAAKFAIESTYSQKAVHTHCRNPSEPTWFAYSTHFSVKHFFCIHHNFCFVFWRAFARTVVKKESENWCPFDRPKH